MFWNERWAGPPVNLRAKKPAGWAGIALSEKIPIRRYTDSIQLGTEQTPVYTTSVSVISRLGAPMTPQKINDIPDFTLGQ